MGPPMLEKQVEESQSRAAPPLSAWAGGRGVTVIDIPYFSSPKVVMEPTFRELMTQQAHF